MKKKEKLQEDLGKLSEFDLDTIRDSVDSLSSFKEDSTLSEDGLRKLENCVRELENLKQSYSWRIIRLLKQNHMLD